MIEGQSPIFCKYCIYSTVQVCRSLLLISYCQKLWSSLPHHLFTIFAPSSLYYVCPQLANLVKKHIYVPSFIMESFPNISIIYCSIEDSVL